MGELDLASCGTVDSALRDLRGAGFGELRLDLRRTTFVDSTAIHLIITWHGRAAEDGFRFTLIEGGDSVRRAFATAGLLDRLPFVRP